MRGLALAALLLASPAAGEAHERLSECGGAFVTVVSLMQRAKGADLSDRIEDGRAAIRVLRREAAAMDAAAGDRRAAAALDGGVRGAMAVLGQLEMLRSAPLLVAVRRKAVRTAQGCMPYVRALHDAGSDGL